MIDIGQELKYRRLKLGLTQQQVAEIVQIPRSRVSEIEYGRYSPSLATLLPLIEALGGELRIEWASPSTGKRSRPS